MLMPDVPTAANVVRAYLISCILLERECSEGAVEAKRSTECLNMAGRSVFGVGVEDRECWSHSLTKTLWQPYRVFSLRVKLSFACVPGSGSDRADC
jgi:hypothetical protein